MAKEEVEQIVDADTGEAPEEEGRRAELAKAYNDAEGGEAEGAEGAEAAEAAEGSEGQEGGAEAAGAEQPEPLEAPEHWDAGVRERFAQADRAWQEWLLERSREMDAAHTRRSQELAPLKPFREAAEQWSPYLQQIGATPDRMFSDLMQTEYALRTGTNADRKQILIGLAQRYNVDFEAPAEASPEDDPFGVQKMVREAVAPLQQRIEAVNGGFQQQQAAAQAAAREEAARIVRGFEDEKGADGKPAHPYFQEVRTRMRSMAQAAEAAGQPVDIASIYEAACWSDPSVRAKMLAEEKRAGQASKRREEQERAKKARAAVGGLGGSGGGGKVQPRSRLKQLEGAWDEASSQ